MTRLFVCTTVSVLLATMPSPAQQSYRLAEAIRQGDQFAIQSRVELTGKLTSPPSKTDKKTSVLSFEGYSSIDYHERILSLTREGTAKKSIRAFDRIKLERKVGGIAQSTALRPEVRRIVLSRRKPHDLFFSPDGALTWSELDLLRTDVFTPALTGLLPRGAVRLGSEWTASTEAVQELTDLEKIDQESLRCRLEQIVTVSQRNQARVSFQGTIKGTNEDGPNRQELNGFFYFDLEGNYLSYLSLRGRHSLLNGEGKEMGRIEGRFVLTRKKTTGHRDLGDAALRQISLEPSKSTTRLLYDNEALKIRFLHPRQWRVGGTRGQQITLDGPEGAGMVITLDPLRRLPTTNQFYQEARNWMDRQKARVLSVARPSRDQARPTSIDRFVIEAEMKSQKVVMDYFVIRDANGGATLAARIPAGREARDLQREAQAIARSLRRK